jgi:hypothetical protein
VVVKAAREAVAEGGEVAPRGQHNAIAGAESERASGSRCDATRRAARRRRAIVGSLRGSETRGERRPGGRRGRRETCGGGGTIQNRRVGPLKCPDGSHGTDHCGCLGCPFVGPARRVLDGRDGQTSKP